MNYRLRCTGQHPRTTSLRYVIEQREDHYVFETDWEECDVFYEDDEASAVRRFDLFHFRLLESKRCSRVIKEVCI